jgi:bacterioferritin (cytochrome b1)
MVLQFVRILFLGLPNSRRLFPPRVDDVTSMNIFEGILSDEEDHIDYLETAIGLVSQLGEQLYLAQLVIQPDN